MIYLSRLILNPRSRQVRRDLANCHDLHRTILSAFPVAPTTSVGARAYFGVLFRVEPDPSSGSIRLLVQSRHVPDWSKLPEHYLVEMADPLDNHVCKRVDEQYDQVRAGMVLVFRLRANPTKRIDRGNDPESERWRGRRVEIRREADQLAWLSRKGGQHGFRVLSVRSDANVADMRTAAGANMLGRRARDEASKDADEVMNLTFGSTLFEGKLEVSDARAFRQTLEDGIGSGKAYGFGLLSIARPQS